jgi:ABC-type maltose transport system permease subunit
MMYGPLRWFLTESHTANLFLKGHKMTEKHDDFDLELYDAMMREAEKDWFFQHPVATLIICLGAIALIFWLSSLFPYGFATPR